MTKRKPTFSPVPQTGASDLSKLKSIDLVGFNSEAERQFCKLVATLITELSDVTPYVAIQEASFELNISPATAKRYLLKHTARRAMFSIVEGFVRAKDALF